MTAYGSKLIQPLLETLEGSKTGQTFVWDNTAQDWTVNYPLTIYNGSTLVGAEKNLTFTGSGIVSVTDDTKNNQIVVTVSGTGGSSPSNPTYILLDKSGDAASLPNYRTLSVGSSLSLSDGGAQYNLNLSVNSDSTVQKVEIMANSGSSYYARKRLNLIGPVTIADDSTNNRVNLTISAAGTAPQYLTLAQETTLPNSFQIVAGTGISFTSSTSNKTLTVANTYSPNPGIQILESGTVIATTAILNFSGVSISGITNDTTNNRVDIEIGAPKVTTTGGSIARFEEDHFNDVISVFDFNVLSSTNGTDTSSTFQAAATYASNISGKRLFIPSGTYTLSNVNLSNLTLVGDSTLGTIIECNDPTKPVFNLSGNVSMVNIQFVYTSSAINEYTKAGNVAIFSCTDNASNIYLENCLCTNAYSFITMNCTGNLILASCNIITYANALNLTKLNTLKIRNCNFKPELTSNSTITTNATQNSTAISTTICSNIVIDNTYFEGYEVAVYSTYTVTGNNTSYGNIFHFENSQILACQSGIVFLLSNYNIGLNISITGSRFNIYNTYDAHLEGSAIRINNDGTTTPSTGIQLNCRTIIDNNHFEYSSNAFIWNTTDISLIITNNHLLNWAGSPKYQKLSTTIAPFAPTTQDSSPINTTELFAINIFSPATATSSQNFVISKNTFDNSYFYGFALYIQNAFTGVISENILRNCNIKIDNGIIHSVVIANNILTTDNVIASNFEDNLTLPITDMYAIAFQNKNVTQQVYLANNSLQNWLIRNDWVGKSYVFAVQTVFQNFNSSNITVIFDTIPFDAMSEYNVSTGVFTPIYSGVYMVNWKLTHSSSISSSDNWKIILVYGRSNGTINYSYADTYYSAPCSCVNTAQGSSIIILTFGDTVRLQVTRTNGSNNFTTQAETTFTIYKMD